MLNEESWQIHRLHYITCDLSLHCGLNSCMGGHEIVGNNIVKCLHLLSIARPITWVNKHIFWNQKSHARLLNTIWSINWETLCTNVPTCRKSGAYVLKMLPSPDANSNNFQWKHVSTTVLLTLSVQYYTDHSTENCNLRWNTIVFLSDELLSYIFK